MATIALAALFAAVACNPTPRGGPAAPFGSRARPRNPSAFDHAGGAAAGATTRSYSGVQVLAIASGVRGMVGYDFQRWLRPSGTLRVEQRNDGATRFRLELTDLVPGGFYSVWLARRRGGARGDARWRALGEPYGGAAKAVASANVAVADERGRLTLVNALAPGNTDPRGEPYWSVDRWDEVRVALAADNRAYGHVPGPHSITQVVMPLHSKDGSALLEAKALGSDAFAPRKTSFAAVKRIAIDANVEGIKRYGEGDWGAATGRVVVDHDELGAARSLRLLVTAEKLVAAGLYTAWLVDTDGHRCPIGRLAVDSLGRGELRARLGADSACDGRARLGELADFAFVELRFHADDTLAGVKPSPESYVQLRAAVVDPYK